MWVYTNYTSYIYTQHECIRTTQVVYTQGYMSIYELHKSSYAHMNILTTQVKYIQGYVSR